MRLPVITVKRGDSIAWPVSYADDEGVPVDLAGYTISAQLRSSSDTVISSLTATPTSPGAGEFELSASAATTAAWAPGSYRCDVQLQDPSGGVISSPTFEVRVVSDVTRSS